MKYIVSLIILISIGISQNNNLSGLVFYNYAYDLSEDAVNDAGFGLDRVYLTYTADLSEDLSYKFQADMQNKNTSVKSAYYMYIKNAKVDWRSPLGKITLGMQGMNVFNVVEKTWGFRFLQKSPMDKYKFSSSADLGIGYSGKFNVINYSFMITNGSGYKNTEDDKYKKISAQFVFGEKKLVKNDGYNIGLVYAQEPYSDSESKNLISFFGGYAKNGFRFGGEFDMHNDSGTKINEQIKAIYGSYKLNTELELLIYYDMFDPDLDTEDDGTTFLRTGINYYPTKGLIITPNIYIKSDDTGDESTYMMLNFQFKI